MQKQNRAFVQPDEQTGTFVQSAILLFLKANLCAAFTNLLLYELSCSFWTVTKTQLKEAVLLFL